MVPCGESFRQIRSGFGSTNPVWFFGSTNPVRFWFDKSGLVFNKSGLVFGDMLRRGVTCCGAEKDAAARRKMLRRGVGHTAAQKDAAARREIAAMRREIAAMRRGNAALQQVAFKSPGDARRKGQERAPVAGPPSRG